MSEELCLYFRQSNKAVSLKDLLKDKEAIIAGRIKGACDLGLRQYFSQGDTRRLSRKHFMIYQRYSQLFIEDLGSTHGTELDGKPLSPGVGIVLHAGRRIRLAEDENFLIEIMDHDRGDDPTIPESDTLIEKPAEAAKTGLEFDQTLNLFRVDGEPIHHLSQMQENLLTYFYRNVERACPYHELNKSVWYGNARKDAMRTAILNLRRKLDEVSPEAGERYIKTLHGYGYKLTRK